MVTPRKNQDFYPPTTVTPFLHVPSEDTLSRYRQSAGSTCASPLNPMKRNGARAPYNYLCCPHALPPNPVGTRAMKEIASMCDGGDCQHVCLSSPPHERPSWVALRSVYVLCAHEPCSYDGRDFPMRVCHTFNRMGHTRNRQSLIEYCRVQDLYSRPVASRRVQ